MVEARMIDVSSAHDANGEVAAARIRFGPHYVVEVKKDGQKVSFSLRYTHHGFEANASEVDGELEQIINEVRAARPGAAVD